MKKKLRGLIVALSLIMVMSAGMMGVLASGQGVEFVTKKPEKQSQLDTGRLVFEKALGKAVSLVSKKTYSGGYTAEFSYYSHAGGYYDDAMDGDFFVTLGHDDPNTVPDIADDNASGLTLAIRAAVLAYNGNVVTSAPEAIDLRAPLDGYALNREVLFRFVVSGTTADVYFDFADTANALSTKRATITAPDAALFDGHIVLTANQNILEADLLSERRISYFSVKQEETEDLDYFVDLTNWNTLGDAAKLRLTGNQDFLMRHNTRKHIPSSNAYTKVGLANDTDAVLDIEFMFATSWPAQPFDAGILFNMPQKDSAATDEGVYYLEINRNSYVSLYRGDGTAKVLVSGAQSSVGVYLHNQTLKIGLTVTKNGEFSLKGQCVTYPQNPWEDAFSERFTASGIEAEGYIAFTANLASYADAANAYFAQFKDIELKGNMKPSLISIALNKDALLSAWEGDTINLSTELVSDPEGATFSYTVTEGAALVELTGNTLQCNAAGRVTLRVSADIDPRFYDEVSFSIHETVPIMDYSLTENFSELKGHWDLNDDEGNLGVSGNKLVFTNDYNDDPNGAARLILNAAFAVDSASDTVFDVTFTGAFGTDIRDLREKLSYGLLFGMKDKDAKANDAGVGFVRIFSHKTEVYNGADKVVPAYKGSRTSENSDVYWDTIPITIRAVAKKDGTLELYRGYSHPGGTPVYEQITELFAVYSGFDFSGYIALTSYCEKPDPATNYTATVSNFNISGKVNLTSLEVVRITLAEAQLRSMSVGMTASLDASVLVNLPGQTIAPVFSITSGDTHAEIVDGNKFKALSQGSVVLRAAAEGHPDKFTEFTVEIQNYNTVQYDKVENFASLNRGDWTLNDGDGNFLLDSGLFITSDFNSDPHGAGSLVSNHMFFPDADSETVFDIQFSTTHTDLEGRLHRNANFNWGILFGMSSQNSKIGDAGTGFFKVNHLTSTAFYENKQLVPEYKSDHQSESYQVYAQAPCYMTFRIVGLSDGTLRVYRGYSDVGVSESISQLHTEYKGLNFGGYIAFTTNSEQLPAGSKYTVHIKDAIIGGNAVFPDTYEILDVKMDTSVFLGAITSDMPLEVPVQVTAKPNFTVFCGYTLRVVSGGAEVTADGKLLIKEEGDIKLRATSEKDPSSFAEHTFNAIDLKITEIQVDEKVFENINSDSQPIDLLAVLVSNSITTEHQRVEWEVVSGNAEIVGKQLRITGKGQVVLRVRSYYRQGSYKDISFTVTDADAGLSVYGSENGCTGVVIGLSVGGDVLLVAGAALLVLRKKKRTK
ncbi:MAG: hypothetical protein LBH18_02340 [Spirochaetaceae bacterium]|jgi:hypothetical protein|nr:hypothetical protein [Spirochaetaceae bacterium]